MPSKLIKKTGREAAKRHPSTQFVPTNESMT
jgi:hypothetical protein